MNRRVLPLSTERVLIIVLALREPKSKLKNLLKTFIWCQCSQSQKLTVVTGATTRALSLLSPMKTSKLGR
jgi:2-C-methyl-D-erythritol 4-phosphate cytidylyltransferase